jgi:hypothetical protein
MGLGLGWEMGLETTQQTKQRQYVRWGTHRNLLRTAVHVLRLPVIFQARQCTHCPVGPTALVNSCVGGRLTYHDRHSTTVKHV